MGLTLWPVPGKAKSKLICNAFAAGAPKSAKGSVFFGTEGVMSAFQKAKAKAAAGQEPFFYLDNSYFDKHRGIYFRVTKNALQVDPRGPALASASTDSTSRSGRGAIRSAKTRCCARNPTTS